MGSIVQWHKMVTRRIVMTRKIKMQMGSLMPTGNRQLSIFLHFLEHSAGRHT